MSLHAEVEVNLGSLHLDVALAVGEGATTAVLGPNGAGKTTLLRVLAGLVAIESGRVLLDGDVLDEPATATFVPPERRPVGFVFQDHLLFPHLSVIDNVAFGLRSGGATRRASRARAMAELEQLDLAGLADRRPRSLSGGQAQRVAVARALATEPRLLLLDEPLAALDATATVEVRRALRKAFAASEGARVLVTHDPVDAFALADQVVIVEEGRVTDVGPPSQVAARPRSGYAAQLMGVNLLLGRRHGDRVTVGDDHELVVAERAEGAVAVQVPPSAVALHRERPHGSPRNVWHAKVASVESGGDRVRVVLAGPVPLTAEVTPVALVELGLQVGDDVWASVKATELSVDRI